MAEAFHAPVVERLGIRPGARVAFVEPPAGYAATLGRLPEDVELLPEPQAPMDVVQFFTRSTTDLDRRLDALKGSLGRDGVLWVTWPSAAAGISTDVGVAAVGRICLRHGLAAGDPIVVDAQWHAVPVRRD